MNTSCNLPESCYALGGDDPTLCGGSTNNMTLTHNPLRTHHTLQTALSPQSSILSGLSRQAGSVQEREVTTVPAQLQQQQQYQQQQSSALTGAAVFNGEMNSIYADPTFEYQEHSVPECEFHTNTIMIYKTISSLAIKS